MCSEVGTGEFTALLYSVLLNVGKRALKLTETLWENGCVIAKYVWIVRVNFIVIALTFSENKWRRSFRTALYTIKSTNGNILDPDTGVASTSKITDCGAESCMVADSRVASQ
jgi:ABC-type phosphate/phosphonate transport system permease subunit